jgi:hypothetical protein
MAENSSSFRPFVAPGAAPASFAGIAMQFQACFGIQAAVKSLLCVARSAGCEPKGHSTAGLSQLAYPVGRRGAFVYCATMPGSVPREPPADLEL